MPIGLDEIAEITLILPEEFDYTSKTTDAIYKNEIPDLYICPGHQVLYRSSVS
jgi:hypothetical protein